MTADTTNKIRVLLVDDSPIVLVLLKRMLATAPDIEVIGTAENGQVALDLIPELKPDVICTDLNMPVMDGLEFTRRVMQEHPTPILVISIAVQKEDEGNVFELLRAGAVDVFPKPRGGIQSEEAAFTTELLNKIRVVNGVVVFHKTQPGAAPAAAAAPVTAASTAPRIAAIGASTGGPQALSALLSAVSADIPVPIVCVQHISVGFLGGLVEWLDSQSPLKVLIADEGMAAEPGHVYFPAEDRHLIVDAEGKLHNLEQEHFQGFRPSVTVLFESIAKSYGAASIGILLTGMGEDGAAGLKSMHTAGATTIAQDEATSTVFGMPRQAIEAGAAGHVLGLPDIAPALSRLFAG